MNRYSAIGAGASYILICIIIGRLLPVFHVATIIAVIVGGFIGKIVWSVISDKDKK